MNDLELTKLNQFDSLFEKNSRWVFRSLKPLSSCHEKSSKKKPFPHICYLRLINVDRNETCQTEYCFSVFFSHPAKNNNENNGKRKNCEHFQKPIIISGNEIMMKVTRETFFHLDSAGYSALFFLLQSYDFLFLVLLHHSENENLKQRWKLLVEQTVKRQKS